MRGGLVVLSVSSYPKGARICMQAAPHVLGRFHRLDACQWTAPIPHAYRSMPEQPPPTAATMGLTRAATSKYTTPEETSIDDLQCQICLGTLTDCVTLEPCGHIYCACCVSHHFAALLQGGQPLACPLRCTAPQRVVANAAVRQLVQV